MKITKVEEFDFWNLSIDLVKEIYLITNSFKTKDLDLIRQLRRAAISTSSNIAEGYERSNNRDFIRFLKITKGSIGEIETQILISRELGYIDYNQYTNVILKTEKLSKMIGGFLKYLIDREEENNFRKLKS